jgi:NADH-quinone oxidoreductase subunit M
MPLLSLLIWLPIVGGIAVLTTAPDSRPNVARWLALIFSLITLGFSIVLWQQFNPHTADMQFIEFKEWIPAFHIHYALGVDGISMPLIVLSNFCTVLVILAAWRVITTRVAQYMAAFLIMSGFMTGVFAAMDAILFYVFWEATLVPMFLIIGIWGGPNRIYATLKFFLYTFLGSVLMLVALLYMYTKTSSFTLSDLYSLPLTMREQIYIFFAFLLAFAVKVPMWPVHTWLPDAHVEAPTGGSVILAAIMLKMGGYGFIRFSLPIVPDASRALAEMMIVLSLIAVVYIGFVAIVQKDMKKLIAYSSIAHMGFVTLAFFIIYAVYANTQNISAAGMGVEGAMVQMISHGFISAALFLCVGVLYDRIHSRLIKDYGGVANTMPVFAAFFMLFALANTGLPGTSGFVGEFLVVLTAFKASFWIAVIAATTLILSPAYTLWMYKRVVFGEVANAKVAALTDVVTREKLILWSLALAVLVLGLWPAPLQRVMHASVEQILTQSLHSKILVKPVF